MKILNVMLMLIVFTTTAQSQGVFPDNGSWYRKYHSIAWGHGGEVLWDITTYNTYRINGDTLINGNTFYKLYDGNAFAVYITTDSLKVYCGEDPGNLRVLFDYGLEAGDSFEFYGPDYPYGTLNQTVNMVDSVMIGGVMRKRIHFQNFSGYGSGPLLIEGIGDVHFGGIELNYSYVAWYANTTTLLCFNSNGTNIYGECTTGISYSNPAPRVYPNPSAGHIGIDLSGFSLPVTITMLTTDGRLTGTWKSADDRFQIFSRNKGIYLLVISDGSSRSVQRVVIL